MNVKITADTYSILVERKREKESEKGLACGVCGSNYNPHHFRQTLGVWVKQKACWQNPKVIIVY